MAKAISHSAVVPKGFTVLICALGTPSAFTEYGTNLVYNILAVVSGEVHHISACTPEQLKEGFRARNGRPVVLSSQELDIRIMNTLVNAGASIIVFAEGCDDSVPFVMNSRKTDIRLAIQIYSQSIACLAPYLSEPTVNILWRPNGATTFDRLLNDVCDALRIELDDAQRQRIFQYAIRTGEDAGAVSIDELMSRFNPDMLAKGAHAVSLSREDHRLVSKALESYMALFDSRLLHFNWPVELFRDSHRPEQSIYGPIDLTGPARHLMFGPLLHLPPGYWRAHIVFMVSENLSGNILYADVVADSDVAGKGETPLPPSGVFSFEIDFVVRDPRQPVALRLVTQSGAIEGVFQLLLAEARFVASTSSMGQ